jgi:hypothetical protein
MPKTKQQESTKNLASSDKKKPSSKSGIATAQPPKSGQSETQMKR